MRPECLQTEEERNFKRTALRGLRAAGTAAVITAGTLLPYAVNASAETDQFTPESPTFSQNSKDKSEEISDLLSTNEAKAVLIAGFGLSVAALASSYFLGKKYDNNMERILRVSGPALFSAATATLLLDSYEQIPSQIPAGLILGASIMAAGQTIVNAFEHHQEAGVRSSAIAFGGALISIGMATFFAIT